MHLRAHRPGEMAIRDTVTKGHLMFVRPRKWRGRGFEPTSRLVVLAQYNARSFHPGQLQGSGHRRRAIRKIVSRANPWTILPPVFLLRRTGRDARIRRSRRGRPSRMGQPATNGHHKSQSPGADTRSGPRIGTTSCCLQYSPESVPDQKMNFGRISMIPPVSRMTYENSSPDQAAIGLSCAGDP